jgi:hypothetical protein
MTIPGKYIDLIKEVQIYGDDPQPIAKAVETMLKEFKLSCRPFIAGGPSKYTLAEVEQLFQDLRCLNNLLQKERYDKMGKKVVKDWLIGTPEFHYLSVLVRSRQDLFDAEQFEADLLEYYSDDTNLINEAKNG